MNDSVEIKVSPEVLDAKAQDVMGEIKQMEQLFKEVQELAARTRYYWIGAAGELHRKLVEDKKGDIEKIIKRLKDHPTNLQKIAGVYRTTESSQTEQSAMMSGNLID